MKTQFKLLAALGLSTAVLGVTAGLAPAQDTAEIKKAAIGEKAPAFTLTDLDGKKHSLADFAGKNVVLEWTNPGCPYIVGCYSRQVVGNTVKAIKEMGEDYVYIAVNSTGIMPEEDVIKTNAAFLKEHKVEIPVLVDHDGTVGRMYDARTTPHVFVIDTEGILRYHGAYTDDARGKAGDEATNFVLNALTQMAAGETVSPDFVKPWGCSVKYAKAGGAEKDLGGSKGGYSKD